MRYILLHVAYRLEQVSNIISKLEAFTSLALYDVKVFKSRLIIMVCNIIVIGGVVGEQCVW